MKLYSEEAILKVLALAVEREFNVADIEIQFRNMEPNLTVTEVPMPKTTNIESVVCPDKMERYRECLHTIKCARIDVYYITERMYKEHETRIFTCREVWRNYIQGPLGIAGDLLDVLEILGILKFVGMGIGEDPMYKFIKFDQEVTDKLIKLHNDVMLYKPDTKPANE